MRYYQPQGHFRLFTTQFRESAPNNQDCQTPSLSRQPIFQTAGLSQNLDSQKNDIHKSGNKQGRCVERDLRGLKGGQLLILVPRMIATFFFSSYSVYKYSLRSLIYVNLSSNFFRYTLLKKLICSSIV